MKYSKMIQPLVLACLLTANTATAWTADDKHSVAKSTAIIKSPEKSNRQFDPFITSIARQFNYDELEIIRLFKRGYGRTELISLLLIARDSQAPLEEIVKQRDNKGRLSGIAESYHLEYRAIALEAEQIYRTIDLQVPQSPAIPSARIEASTESIINEELSPAPVFEETTTP